VFFLRGSDGTAYEVSNDIRECQKANESVAPTSQARIWIRIGQALLPLSEKEIKHHAELASGRIGRGSVTDLIIASAINSLEAPTPTQN
jgi:hypothetical protein